MPYSLLTSMMDSLVRGMGRCMRSRGKWAVSIYLALPLAMGCRDLAGEQTLGNEQVPPRHIQNASGAYGMAILAQLRWQQGLASYIIQSGVLTDELQVSDRGSLESALTASSMVLLDARILTTDVTNRLYSGLHDVRNTGRQAISALTKYAGDSSAARRGALFAMTGYAELFLADIYCSGIPLSTLDFEADYTYRPGSSTADVYRHAIALFDTALSLASDSLPIVHWATVGKGRALLALGEVAAAAQVVHQIPPDFVHNETIYTCGRVGVHCANSRNGAEIATLDFNHVSVSNGEGRDSAITWTNPLTAAQPIGTGLYGAPVYFPGKYVRNGISLVTVASGIEAALIRAEAALNADDIPGWLLILNALRASSPLTDTMIVLTDPGMEKRRDTLFAERARWLFLTGHRQGDLRRWLRQEPTRVPQDLYPTGVYPGGIRNYGNDIVLPIRVIDEGNNPHFRACVDRRA